MNTYYIAGYPVSDALYHHGIKGQRWGIRRYQNMDGSLTAAGRERYGSDVSQVKESKLKRQNMRLLSNNKTYPSKQGEEMQKFFKDIHENSDSKGIDRKKAKEIGETYIKNLASARLQAMGYEANEKNVSYLAGKKWFRNTTLLSNTLATIGVADVDYTSNNDFRYGKRFSVK